jgi:hypothetical protein
MTEKKLKRIQLLLVCIILAGMIGITSGVSAATSGVVWMGASGSGWGSFMQTILQQDYYLKMSNGTPYWNALMLPVAASGVSPGMTSYMGMPAFGFCPESGQCYMVLVQKPLPYSSMAACPPSAAPVTPGSVIPNQQGKPTSLW